MAVLTSSYKKVATTPLSAHAQGKADDRPNHHWVNVLVRWNTGKTLCLQVTPDVVVADLFLRIWEKAQPYSLYATSGGSRYPWEATSTMDVCLVCRGKVLDRHDARPLAALVGHQGGGTYHVQVWTRQRGGCFMISFSILGIILAAVVGSTCTCGLSLLIVPVLLPLLFILPLCCL